MMLGVGVCCGDRNSLATSTADYDERQAETPGKVLRGSLNKVEKVIQPEHQTEPDGSGWQSSKN